MPESTGPFIAAPDKTASGTSGDHPDDHSDNIATRRSLTPDPHAMQLARHILKTRFEFTHRDMNAMNAAARMEGIPYEQTFFGTSGADSRSVIFEVADENLRLAPAWRLERRVATLSKKVAGSIAHTIARFDPNTLGGRGAAGRVRDRANAALHREIFTGDIARIRAELERRASGT